MAAATRPAKPARPGAAGGAPRRVSRSRPAPRAGPGLPAHTPSGFLAEIADRAETLTVVIDALDEANEPDELVLETLYPLLARATDQSPLRLLLGTRRHIIDKLGSRVAILDLDEEQY